MDKQREFETIVAIVERAEKMGIARGDRFTKIMDIDYAHKQFNLRLDEFLTADSFDFTHDFTGIQTCMNRDTCRIEGMFVPRFAGNR